MGAYLSMAYLDKPIKKKDSGDFNSKKIKCGYSTMQGWRNNQEDYYSVIEDYDEDSSYFAVFDGHGGHEVAKYCSENLAQFLKEHPAYKDGDIQKALIDGFLEFDELFVKPEVVEILKEWVQQRKENARKRKDKHFETLEKKVLEKVRCSKARKGKTANEKADSDEEENVKSLYEEAHMPIEQVLEKYKKSQDSPKKKDTAAACSSSSAGCSSSGTSSEVDVKPTNGENITADSVSGSCSKMKDKDKTESVSNSNGEIPSGTLVTEKRTKTTNIANSVNAEDDSEEDDEDEEDSTFVGNESSDDEDDDEDEIEGEEDSSDADVADVENEEEDEECEDEDESEEEEDWDDLDDDELSEEDKKKLLEYREKPGVDSGTTATCAILRSRELYVAHAGDSRAVLARRNGKAEDITIDHKPQDAPELERITKAGGKVCSEGRINGGLNLSRAFGDHKHKMNKELSNREQMVSVLPDVKKISIDPSEHDFIVLASDGIWNSLSSQEVVDYVKERIEKKENLSKICEELFDHCLAESTFCDASGCDNMTMIIVQFKEESTKRPSSPGHADETRAKKARTENETTEVEQQKV